MFRFDCHQAAEIYLYCVNDFLSYVSMFFDIQPIYTILVVIVFNIVDALHWTGAFVSFPAFSL
jgi:hypothetical protein